MSSSVLDFEQSFPIILKEESEKVFKLKLHLGNKLQSSDSFSYLLESESEKFVGKIYRFEHWPPEGKLRLVEELLQLENIPHEQILFTSYNHPKFKFGWQISKYITGKTARDLLRDKKIDYQQYYTKLGKLLQNVHKIKLDYFGSIHDKKKRFKSFQQLAKYEIENLNFENLVSENPSAFKIINDSKSWVLTELSKHSCPESVLVHDDANTSNTIWKDENPILIDWVDSLAAPPLREFATLTFRQDESVLRFIEEGYGRNINKAELKLHQVIRLIRLGRYFYLDDRNTSELTNMMHRLKNLLLKDAPYGA